MKRYFVYALSYAFVWFAALPLAGQQSYLPNFMTAEEERLIPGYIDNRLPIGITDPPFSVVRTAAEWEEAQALVVTWTWPVNIVRQIVEHAKEEVPVYVVCTDSNSVKSNLTSNGVSLTNLFYLEAPYNSVWIRDYGQWNVYTDDVDSLLLIDWIYNRPRPADDAIPDVVADAFNLPLYSNTAIPYDLVHTGGNFMVDGFGTGFSSKLVLEENDGGAFNLSDKSEDEVDDIMEAFMGIDRYIKMETLPYDGIHHIDMHMKLLDEETLLVGVYPPGVADGPQIEQNLAYVRTNFNSVFGTPYEVIRITMPPDQFDRYPDAGGYYRTFTNSIFINDLVLVPIYEEQYDTTALRIYREALPGYNVVGINCNEIIPASGALHCITKLVHSSDPLLISHQKLRDTEVTSGTYHVEALIKHRSGISEATLHYKFNEEEDYTAISMLGGIEDIWNGEIPAQSAGTTVYYYIEAESFSGKSQVRPLPAPEGHWAFRVLGDPSAISDMVQNLSVDVFPNPVNYRAQINLESNVTLEQIDIALYDVLGRRILAVFNGNLNPGSHNFVVNTEALTKGTYLIRILNQERSVGKKVIIR